MNDLDWPGHIQFGVSLFALMAPFNIAPVFLVMTSGMANRDRVLCATAAAVAAFVVLVAFFLFGETVIGAMGTSLASFQIAGGIIISLAGFSMMSSSSVASEEDFEVDKGVSALHLGVAPIGIPLLGGAGTMTKVMLEGHSEFSVLHDTSVILIILLVCGTSWLVLMGATLLIRVIGLSGIQVFQRVLGLVLMAMGVEILASGVLAHAEQFARAQ